MSNIIKRPEVILSSNEIKLSNALTHPMLMDISKQQKDAATVSLIASVFANVNEKNPDSAVLMKMKSDLRELMETEFKAMRIEEIKIALDWGSDNWDGHGVSSKLIKSWIRTWRQSKKLDIQKSIAIKSKRDKSIVTKEFSKSDREKSVTDAFIRFKEGGVIASNVYTHLKHLGYSLPKSDHDNVFKQAIRELRKETTDQRNAMNSVYVNARLAEINSDSDSGKVKSPAVKGRCQKLAIEKIFTDCIEMDVDPLELIE